MATEADSEERDSAEGRRAWRADARRNRARVLDAVWRLLATKRPEELSMEDVAREADIGKGTLYRHYPNKECLFDALVSEGAERIAQGMRERIPPEADAPTKLRALVALIYDAYENYQISVELLISSYLSETVRKSEQKHPIVGVIDRVRAILAQGMREGAFRSLNLDYTAMAVFSLISPIAFAKQRERLGYTRDDLEELTMDLLLHALRP